ncbi:MAG: hypothetical protein M1312_01755 [Patescibacteria group bacterium]|nr:hypothetical protein [Patescibacteria group bacterium]
MKLHGLKAVVSCGILPKPKPFDIAQDKPFDLVRRSSLWERRRPSLRLRSVFLAFIPGLAPKVFGEGE